MHARLFVSALTALISVAIVSTCAPSDEQQEELPPDATAVPSDTPPAAAPPAAQAQAPDTTEAAFWAYLQGENYQSWQRWPGTEQLYPGTEPHGALLTTYVNPLAHDALTNGAPTMPEGAIIVKENYMPDSTLVAVTAMHKVPGWDPENNDWFWSKWDPEGVADPATQSRGGMCADCHGQQADADYLWTARPGG